VNADTFDAFASPNFPPVGTVGINVEINWPLVPAPNESPRMPDVVALGSATVAAFRVFPGLDASYLTHVLAPPVQGVVLECYGAGNAPSNNDAFLEALRSATEQGTVIVDVTQPLHGTADLDLYATGHALARAGVVSGYDLTTEAALAKLYYLFEQGHAPEEVRRLMQENLRGELTPPDEVPPNLGRSRQRLAGYR
jgi:L-asparaginase